MLHKTHLRSFCGAIILGLLAAISTPALAANDAMMDLLKILMDKGSISQDEYELLKNAARADNETNTEGQAEIANAAKTLPKIDTNGKLKLSSANGDFEWQPIGRIMVDYNWIASDKNKLGSQAEFRRTRLGMEGLMWGHWIWKLEFDFASAEADMQDAYIGYKDGDSWLKVGQQHVPFGFSTMSSSKYMLFTERSMGSGDVLQPGRRIGISGFTAGNDYRWTFHTGLFAGPSGDDDDCLGTSLDECDESVTAAARGTFLLFMQDANHLVNAGGAVFYSVPQDSLVRVRARPYFHVTEDRFIDANFGANGTGNNTGGLAAESVLGLNAEALLVYGPFTLGGEYTYWNVNTEPVPGLPGSTPDVSFDAYYIEASYFLTGESMNYNTKKAQYDKISPNSVVGKGGWGAWQIAARYDVLDLNDSDLGAGSGGEMRAGLIGLNWYVTQNMRFMADFYKILETDRPGNKYDGDEPYGVTVRGQVFW